MTTIDEINIVLNQLPERERRHILSHARVYLARIQGKREKRRKRFKTEEVSFAVMGD